MNFRCTHERRNPKNGLRSARTAYCFGCDHTFDKMHELRNHRRSERCGGRFLSPTVRLRINIIRSTREQVDRELRSLRCTQGTGSKK